MDMSQEDMYLRKDKKENKLESESVPHDSVLNQNFPNNDKLEIVFLRRRSKIDEKLRQEAEDALRYENHK